MGSSEPAPDPKGEDWELESSIDTERAGAGFTFCVDRVETVERRAGTFIS